MPSAIDFRCGEIMTERKKGDPSGKRRKALESPIEAENLRHPAVSDDKQLSTAEALQQILEYATQQANACGFTDLGLLAEKAHFAAVELVLDLKRASHRKRES